MADEPLDYNEELNLRHARFVALGGNTDIQTDLKQVGWNMLKDQITDAHRKIVFDLAASGISNQDIADVMGISKERLQTLFKPELQSAYQLCHASLARSLYFLGISGDGRAAETWLKLHNRSKWATKTQLSGSEDGSPIKTEDTGAKEVLQKLLAGMSTDKKLTRKPSGRTGSEESKPESSKSAATSAKKPKLIRRPKDEQTKP
jgi:AraC-like DNA-binding protein